MKKLFYLTLLLICSSSLFQSCEKEDVYFENNLSNYTSILKEQFNYEDYKKALPYKFEVQWDKGIEAYSEDLELAYYEFPVIYTSTLNPNNIFNANKTANTKKSFKVIAIENESDNYNFYIVKFIQNLKNENSILSNADLHLSQITSDFNGFIHLLNKKNEIVYAKKVTKNGNNKIYFAKEFKKRSFEKIVIEECHTVTVHHYIDYYYDRGDYLEYNSTRYIGTTHEWSCDYVYLSGLNSGGGGSGAYSSGSGDNGAYNNCDDPIHGCVHEIEDAVVSGWNENTALEIGPDNPINDVTDFLKCFDSTKSATITIYVNEPDPGTGKTHNNTFVGHTFVSIQQGSNTCTFGYYPVSDNIYPIINNSGQSTLGDDGSGNEPFSASISTTIGGSVLGQIINASTNYNPTYHLDNYNCTDFAIELANISGMSLPQCNGIWPGGGGSNPGTLGAYIRSLTTANTNTVGGKAPATNKGC